MIHMRGTKRILLAIPMMVFALVAACAVPPPPEQGMVDTVPLKRREGIVFGILAPHYYNSKGEKLADKAIPDISYTLFFGTAESIAMKRAFSGLSESMDGNTKNPETLFAMKLPAGQYSIFKLYRPFAGTTGTVLTDMRFTVAPNKATYIGSLQIEFRATRGLFGEERVAANVAFEVTDDAEKATNMYRERNPNLGYEITTNLMKIEEIEEKD
jgi:hypothetical protein